MESFDKSIKLYKNLGKIKLSNGNNIHDSLCIDEGISLWDTVATFLILYRFPLLFSDSKDELKLTFKSRIRPIIGKAARIKDSFKIKKLLNKYHYDYWSNNENKKILIPVFNSSHFYEVLHPVVRCLNSKNRYETIILTNNFDKNIFNESQLNYQQIWQYWNKDTLEIYKTIKKVVNSS